MERKLKWHAIGLETKISRILDSLESIKESFDPTHTAKIKKVQGLINELLNIKERIVRIKNHMIPRLEEKFRLEFKTPELVYLAFLRPSLRNIFSNISSYYANRESSPLKQSEFDELVALGNTGDVLALIGDSAIKLAIVETLWDSSCRTVGQLTGIKATIESNRNMAKFCDELGLYNHILDKNEPTKQAAKEKTILHEKGTLVEAIYGIIYLEFGFEELMRLVPLLQ
ncbi:MAG: ribonuclease III domain-containing protein [Promethearchaeota archaeon]